MLHPTLIADAATVHTYGVDGSVAVADVCGPGFSGSPCTAADGWRTLLVGALRARRAGPLRAGHHRPDQSPGQVGDRLARLRRVPRLGYTWGAPVVARTVVSDRQAVVGLRRRRSAAGPGPPGPRASTCSTPGPAQLLDDGTSKASYDIWDDPADPAVNAVASRPTLYRPADKSMVERVFFNDTEGKMWRMNTTGTALTTWAVSAGLPTAADAFFDPANASDNSACLLNVNGDPHAHPRRHHRASR